MSELNGLLERVKIFNLISFLLYGVDSALQTTKTYEERIEESYTQFFNDLKKYFHLLIAKMIICITLYQIFLQLIMKYILKWV